MWACSKAKDTTWAVANIPAPGPDLDSVFPCAPPHVVRILQNHIMMKFGSEFSEVSTASSAVPFLLSLGLHLCPFHIDRNTHHAVCP